MDQPFKPWSAPIIRVIQLLELITTYLFCEGLNAKYCSFITGLSTEDYKKVMTVLEQAILATDLASYFEKRDKFRTAADDGEIDWQVSGNLFSVFKHSPTPHSTIYIQFIFITETEINISSFSCKMATLWSINRWVQIYFVKSQILTTILVLFTHTFHLHKEKQK